MNAEKKKRLTETEWKRISIQEFLGLIAEEMSSIEQNYNPQHTHIDADSMTWRER